MREPRIVTLKYTEGDGQELFSIGLEKDSPLQQITQSDGRILNYAVSSNGGVDHFLGAQRRLRG